MTFRFRSIRRKVRKCGVHLLSSARVWSCLSDFQSSEKERKKGHRNERTENHICRRVFRRWFPLVCLLRHTSAIDNGYTYMYYKSRTNKRRNLRYLLHTDKCHNLQFILYVQTNAIVYNNITMWCAIIPDSEYQCYGRGFYRKTIISVNRKIVQNYCLYNNFVCTYDVI